MAHSITPLMTYKDHMRGADGNYLQVKWDNPLNNTSNNTVCVLLATNDKNLGYF